MSEWLKEHAWKACVGETLPRVRIPLSPPINLFYRNEFANPEGLVALVQSSRAHLKVQPDHKLVDDRLSTEEFFADVRDGTLPSFSIVDPDFKAYSEENPHDVKQGESFASEVIKRVMHGKGWANTLLICLGIAMAQSGLDFSTLSNFAIASSNCFRSDVTASL